MSTTKPIDTITIEDLQSLIDDKVAEEQRIDYKADLPCELEQQQDEFRRDIASFANSAGGDLVIGIKEKNGLPLEVSGIELNDPDRFKLKLEDLLQSKVRPRIIGVTIKCVELKNGRWVVIVRVPKSFNAPHEVRVGKDGFQFWARNSGGKYRLDVEELRSIYVAADSFSERIRSFRIERLGKILSDETPVPVRAGPRLIIHMIPLSSFQPGISYDLARVNPVMNVDLPWNTPKWTISNLGLIRDTGYTFDGLVLSGWDQGKQLSATSYLQIFSNGIIETVQWSRFGEYEGNILSLTRCEKWTINAIPDLMEIQTQLGVQPPLLVAVTLTGVAGYEVLTEQYQGAMSSRPIDRDVLTVPETQIEKLPLDLEAMLQPVFDALWRAGGFPWSPNFVDGKWSLGARR